MPCTVAVFTKLRAFALLPLVGLIPLREAHGSEQPVEPSEAEQEHAEQPGPGRKTLAAGAAVVPGVLLHGSGSWVEGDEHTATQLLLMEGLGLGLIAAGGVPIALTGASRYIVGPAAAATVLGFGLFTVSWAADIYAVAAPEGGFGSPPRWTPWIRTELGHRYVYDARFDYRHFVVQRIDWRAGSFRIVPSAWWSTNTNNARLQLLAGYRISGPLPRMATTNGSSMDIEAAVTRHHFGDDSFTINTLELAALSRTDLDEVSPALEGSFVELGLGGAIQSFDYDVPGQDVPSELETMLLARFGFGMYIGGPSAPDGELLLYYDHRHDGYAAGLLSTLPTSGVLGHFGFEGHVFATERWGIGGQAQIGSALVAGLSLLFREDMR